MSNPIYKENILKMFPDCKIEFMPLGDVEITFCFGTESITKLISAEFLHRVADKELLEHIKYIATAEIENRVIEKFLKRERKTERYIVSPYIPIGSCLIHPVEYLEKLKEIKNEQRN